MSPFPSRWLRLRLLSWLFASSLLGGVELARAAPPEPLAAQAEERIYRGSYYLRGAPASAPQLFWYERWHKAEAGLLRSTHVHHALGGRVLLRQSALHSSDYRLSQFDSEQRQTGIRVTARVLEPGRVRLERTGGSEHETVVLEHQHPLVVGPTLYGTMLQHWAELMGGRRLIVDYLSIERLDTYAFEIRKVASDARTTSFELAANSLLLSFLISPLRVVFDSKSHQVLRYEGPSPVLLEQNGELESFAARIEYSERASVFR